MWQDNQFVYAVTTSGNDFLDTGEFTTKAANSTFSIVVTLCHGVGDEINNMDSHDTHLYCMRSAAGTHVYVGASSALIRTTGNAPASGKFYSTDVPFSPSRGDTYGNDYDTFNRSGHFVDSPSLGAGVTNQYRIRMYNQATMYINRGRGSASQAGGVSSLMIMECAV